MKQNLVRTIIRILGRLAVVVFVVALVWSCGHVPGLKEDRVTNVIRVPFVRVLLEEGQEKLTLAGDGSFAIECIKDGKQSVFYSGRPVTAINEYGKITVLNAKDEVIAEQLSEVNVIPRGSGNRVSADGERYRGLLKILPVGETTRLINVIYMEDYLRGVVPPEIGPRTDDELEAIKAQAVAARTYAMAHLKQYGNAPYDIKASIIDQVYEGAKVENKLVNLAIDETAGRVLFYQDQFINAYYHSTCGGMTDNIEHVWDRQELPYLKAVNDGSACSWSKYFKWQEVFTEDQLRGRIEQYLASDRGRDLRIGTVRDLIIGKRTAGGRIEKLSVRTDQDLYSFHKDRIRWVLGRTSNPDLILPSDRFDIDIERDGQGNISRVIFAGSGYGHGVGMCQCGAIGLAREGRSFDEILTLYYTDVDVRKLY